MTGVQTCALPICFPVTIRGERELWNGIFNEILSEEPVQGIQHGGGDRVYVGK